MRSLFHAAAIGVLLSVVGCATGTPAPVSGPGSTVSERAGWVDIKQALYRQLDHWRGTRYRYGGMGKTGVDCSGLTYVVYRDLFNKDLPRTTEAQGKIGRSVSRRSLAPGDLVFFKTGMFQKHVGIYIEDGMFFHASKGNGVGISRLTDDYWRKRYWKARRMDVI